MVIGPALGSLNKNKKWVLIGALLYMIPVIYRYATKHSVVPILDDTLFFYHSNSQTIPVNLETFGIPFIIIGAIGAIFGTTYLEILFNRRFAGFEKYVGRVLGSLFFAFCWVIIQFLGYSFFNPIGPWGNHIWVGPDAYARNLLLALVVSPLIPYLIELIYKLFKRFLMK